ncbi:MAG: hypothetical protein HUU08_10390 [Candidatus Brocadia sp.]|nr:hypothetical protein [Candidatus Brocadia sp.]
MPCSSKSLFSHLIGPGEQIRVVNGAVECAPEVWWHGDHLSGNDGRATTGVVL